MNWLLVVLFVAFLVYLWKLSTPSSYFWKYGNLIPGPKALPMLGNGMMFLAGKPLLQVFRSVVDEYGPVTRVWLGKNLFLILSDLKDIEVFLAHNDHLNKSNSYRILDTWLGRKNMLTSDAEIWKVHRKLLTPSFHFKILENAIGMIQRHGNILCQQLESQVEQPEFCITEYMEKCNLDVICETAMGIDLQCQSAQYSQYFQNLKLMEFGAVNRAITPWLVPDLFFRLSSYGRAYFKGLNEMKPFVQKVIRDRKAMLAKTNGLSNETQDDGIKKPKPFLDLLLESNFTDEEIEDEVQTIMFAGHDTTKTTLSFCLYSLSNYPQIQEKLIQEIDDMFAQKGENLSVPDYNNLKYLDNVIKETLRMYTPVPLIARRVAKEVTLPSGYTIPAGCETSMFLWYNHTNDKYFEDPKSFKPERFENRERKNPYEYIPFSAGSRNCVGQKFAILEMKILLCQFFRNYRLLPAVKHTTLDLDVGLVLYSKTGLYVRIAKRH